MDMENFYITKKIYFDSAHKNEWKRGKFARLHGHTYFLEIYAKAPLDEKLGWIVDFGDIKKFFAPIVSQLDHQYLNQISSLAHDASLPALRKWILEQIPSSPPWLKDIQLGILGDLQFAPRRLPPCDKYPEMWQFSFESAQSLPQLPKTHPCSQIHGHSYFVKVSASDMTTLPEKLEIIYNEIDHRYLNDIPGLEMATSEILTFWIVKKLRKLGVTPKMVIVEETPTSKCIWSEN